MNITQEYSGFLTINKDTRALTKGCLYAGFSSFHTDFNSLLPPSLHLLNLLASVLANSRFPRVMDTMTVEVKRPSAKLSQDYIWPQR